MELHKRPGPRVSSSERHLLVAMAYHCNERRRDRTCRVSMRTLANETGRALSNVQIIVTGLRQLGLVTGPASTKNITATYTIADLSVWPSVPATGTPAVPTTATPTVPHTGTPTVPKREPGCTELGCGAYPLQVHGVPRGGIEQGLQDIQQGFEQERDGVATDNATTNANTKENKRPKAEKPDDGAAWYSSRASIAATAEQLGIARRTNEDYDAFADRVTCGVKSHQRESEEQSRQRQMRYAEQQTKGKPPN